MSFEKPNPISTEDKDGDTESIGVPSSKVFLDNERKRLFDFIVNDGSDEEEFFEKGEVPLESPSPESIPDIKEVVGVVIDGLVNMRDYLVTTEEDEAAASGYYGGLINPVIEELTDAESVSEIVGLMERIEIKDINGRFYDSISGNLRNFFLTQRQGLESSTPPFEHPSVRNIFNNLIPKMKAYDLVDGALNE